MTDELEAISPSTVFISGKAITEKDVLDAIDNVYQNLINSEDFQQVDQTIDTLLGLQRLSGKSLAKLLYMSKYWWIEHKENENFDDYMESRHGLKKVTIDRYITVWVNIIDGIIPPELASRPMRDLVPIAKALSQGYELTKDVIKRLVKATSNSEIGDILRNVKGKSARKGSRQIRWERDGSIYTWKNNVRKFCGWWDREAYENDVDVREAINIMIGERVIKK